MAMRSRRINKTAGIGGDGRDSVPTEPKDRLFAESTGPRSPYSAASASAWPGNSPAYLVMPTMVKTLAKCGESPKA